MKTHSKDEVLGLAESLAMKASTEEFNGYTSNAELLSCAAGVLRDFAQTLGEPVAVPDAITSDDATCLVQQSEINQALKGLLNEVITTTHPRADSVIRRLWKEVKHYRNTR